jgi:hypothetical protein
MRSLEEYGKLKTICDENNVRFSLFSLYFSEGIKDLLQDRYNIPTIDLRYHGKNISQKHDGHWNEDVHIEVARQLMRVIHGR